MGDQRESGVRNSDRRPWISSSASADASNVRSAFRRCSWSVARLISSSAASRSLELKLCNESGRVALSVDVIQLRVSNLPGFEYKTNIDEVFEWFIRMRSVESREVCYLTHAEFAGAFGDEDGKNFGLTPSLVPNTWLSKLSDPVLPSESYSSHSSSIVIADVHLLCGQLRVFRLFPTDCWKETTGSPEYIGGNCPLWQVDAIV